MVQIKPEGQPVERSEAGRGEIVTVALLMLLTAVVLGKDITVGGLRHGDSAVHAMDGVLVHDWVGGGLEAWRQPMAFAEAQYAHYPTLGIGRHYPPGFAVVEAAFFTVLGVSALSARLCVVFFGLAAAAGAYVFVRSLAGRLEAVLATVALVTMPVITRWGRQVMLEIPTLAVLIWAAVVFAYYVQRPTGWRLILLLGVSLAALAFKQSAIFMVVALAVTLVIGGLFRVTPRWQGWLVACVAAAAVLAVMVSLDGHGAQLLRGDATFPDRWSAEALTYYARRIPRQVGWPLLAAGFVGLLMWSRHLGIHGVLLGCWFVACYGMLATMDYKNPRFLLVGLFPLAVGGGLGAGYLVSCLPGRAVRGAAVVTLALVCGGVALIRPIRHRPDYGSVVTAYRNAIEGRAVLFSGLREGDFVFAVRQHIPWRRAVVVRGSKLLYTCNGRTDLDFRTSVGDRADLQKVMRRFAFRSVIVEREDKLDLREERMLRAYLREQDEYMLVGSCRFQMGSQPGRYDATLDVYESRVPRVRHVDHFDIFIPRSGRTVRLNLRGWS
ncbi:MAG: ArnT family glycosyltransferase [Phycisphaerae bacterium]